MKNLFDTWKSYLVESRFIGIDDFSPKGELYPKIWENGNLRSEIRSTLLDKARDFLAFAKAPESKVVDITFTGSLVNYNWTDFSDLDVHIVLDFRQFSENVSMVKQFFDAKSKIWNIEHNIFLHEHEIELYVQDLAEADASTGVFSLVFNRWVKKPHPKRPNLDPSLIKKKTERIQDTIEQIEKHLALGNHEIAYKTAQKMKKKLHSFQKCGLEQCGTHSPEGITLKNLLKSGYYRKLSDLSLKAHHMTSKDGPGHQNSQETLQKFNIFRSFDQKVKKKAEENEI